jgi:hypothetical protein
MALTIRAERTAQPIEHRARTHGVEGQVEAQGAHVLCDTRQLGRVVYAVEEVAKVKDLLGIIHDASQRMVRESRAGHIGG